MHVAALVMIPADGDAHEHVERLMQPHQEDYALHGIWDYYFIGGIWNGTLDGGNVQPASSVDVGRWCPASLLTPDGEFHECDDEREGEWKSFVREALAQHNGRVVVVDYHS